MFLNLIDIVHTIKTVSLCIKYIMLVQPILVVVNLFGCYSTYIVITQYVFFFFPISFQNNIITSVLFIIIETGYCIILLSFALYWKQRKFYPVHDDLICIASSRLRPFRNNDDANFCGLVTHRPGATGRCI